MRFNYRSAAVLVALIYNRPRGPEQRGKKTSVQGRRENSVLPLPLLRFGQLLFFFFHTIVLR